MEYSKTMPIDCCNLPNPISFQNCLRHRIIHKLHSHIRTYRHILPNTIKDITCSLSLAMKHQICVYFLNSLLHMRSNRLNRSVSNEISQIIIAFIEFSPISCMIPDEEGNTALHKAFEWGNIDQDVVISLLTAASSISSQSSTSDISILSETSIPIYNMDKRYDFSSCNMEGYAPIHSLIASPVLDFSVLRLILLAFPNAAKIPTRNGLLPLHILMKRKDLFQQTECISLLIQSYPISVTLEIEESYSRIHLEGGPPTKIQERWSPYDKALKSDLSVRQIFQKEIEKISYRRCPSRVGKSSRFLS